MAQKASRKKVCGLDTWHYCLSLSSAVVLYSFLLLLCASWQAWLCLSPALLGSDGPYSATSLVDLVRSGAATQGNTSRSSIGDEDAPEVQVDRRERQVVTGWLVCLVVCCSLNVLIALMSLLALLFKLSRLALLLGWLTLFNVVFCLSVLLMHFFVEEVGAISRRWKVRKVVAWIYGFHLDLWLNILAGFPLTHVYASLSNIQEAGGTGFEAKPIRSLVPPTTAVRLLAVQQASSFMRSLGTWSVGLTLARGGLAWSVLCIATAVSDFGSSLLAASLNLHIPAKMSYLLIAQGTSLCVTAILGAAGIMGTLRHVTLAALFFNVTGCLQGVAVVTGWWLEISLVPAMRGATTIIESQAIISLQYILLLMLWPSSRVLSSLAAKQREGLTGFEPPTSTLVEEESVESLDGAYGEGEEHRSLIETGAG